MSITILDNQPVSFNSNLNQLGSDCNCKGQPFCQLVENTDITSFQFKTDHVSANLVLNGEFNSGTSWDVSASTWTIAGGKATHTPGSAASIGQPSVVYEAGKRYKLTLTISGRTQGTLSAGIGFDFQVLSTNGTHNVYVDGSAANILLAPSSLFNGSMDDISIYELASSFIYSISDVNGVVISEINNFTETIVDDHVLVEFPWDYQDLSPGCYKICITDQSSNNVVINGTFNSDSDWIGTGLGSELITNGGFASGASWVIPGTDWSIGSGVARYDHFTGPDNIYQTTTNTAGVVYKLQYDIVHYTTGSITPSLGVLGTTRTSAGTFSENISPVSANQDLNFEGIASGADFITIDNVSLRQVHWQISGGKVTHFVGDATDLTQAGILSIGLWRIKLVVSGRTSGTVTPKAGSTPGTVISANGSYEMNILSNGTSLTFTPSADFDGSIDSVEAYLVSEDVTYCSDCFSLKQSHGCSFLLSWYNIEDNFDFVYSTGYVHRMRVKGKLWKPKHAKDKKVFKFSDASRKVLFAESDKVEVLTLEEMPAYMHDALSSGIDHDYFMIGEDHYTAEPEDYEPVWRNSSLLAPVIIEVIRNFQPVLRNDNC